jgi:hypothetical protein
MGACTIKLFTLVNDHILQIGSVFYNKILVDTNRKSLLPFFTKVFTATIMKDTHKHEIFKKMSSKMV